MKILLCILFISSFTSYGGDKESEYRNSFSEELPVYLLSERLIGKKATKNFIFELKENSQQSTFFKISSVSNKIKIEANNMIGLTSGYHWYLKYYLNINISWEAKNISLPKKFPIVEKPIRKNTNFDYSYYLNYCTYSYSMAFWSWERWEKELDWMALNGIDLPLSIIGNEVIWQNTLKKFNLSEQEIKDFIPGPGFKGWWLMGNLEGYGGKEVTQEYFDKQVKLQIKILKRMNELGMEPVYFGFFGMVPTSLKKYYPQADIRPQGKWAGGFQRPDFLSPTDPLFIAMANTYYEEVKKIYGDIKYFSGDPFHEGGNSHGIDLAEAGKNIVFGMKDSYPNAIWVFQGWSGNPHSKLIAEIPNDNLIILDLDCDNRPQWIERNGWEDKPWIWSMVSNFGGNVGMFGRLDVINEQPHIAQKKYGSNLKGIGAMMEGINNNSIIYEFLFEKRWHSEPVDLNLWLVQYAERRYGERGNERINSALQILKNTVWGKKLEKESQQGTSESFLCARPSLEVDKVSTWGTSKLYYDPKDLLEAWTIFVEESDNINKIDGFNYDLVDITRQVLANYSQVVLKKIRSSYLAKDKNAFINHSNEFLEIIDDQDRLLSTIQGFMLGTWLREARELGSTEKEKNQFEYNARVQLTTWSFQDSNLHEYAHKEWAGLLKDFYKPRWEMFFEYLNNLLNDDQTEAPDYYKFEDQWNNENKKYNNKPKEVPTKVTKELYNKYFMKIKNNYIESSK